MPHARGSRHGMYRHGFEGTRTYKSWDSMWERCGNPNAAAYARYGGQGIIVCERWRDFANFLADMGERPEGKTLDRINGSGNYEPDNCRWATPAEQQANRRDVKLIYYEGKYLLLRQWARNIGISRTTLGRRLAEGWSVEQAFSIKPRHYIRSIG